MMAINNKRFGPTITFAPTLETNLHMPSKNGDTIEVILQLHLTYFFNHFSPRKVRKPPRKYQNQFFDDIYLLSMLSEY